MYSLLIHFYAFIVAMISPFHRKARLMRFGQWKTNSILREKIDRNAKYIWFHASSLGEFEQGRPMIEKVKAQYPEYKILLTFFSPSGYEVRKNYNGADIVCYLPFDTPYRVKKFLNLANPAVAVFIKYEFWGNYLRELKKRGIPVYIISAIFRPDQLFFQWFGVPYRKMLYCFTHLFVQDERSKELLGQYGIRNVTVYGDTRFDRVLDVRNQARELPEFERFVGERLRLYQHRQGLGDGPVCQFLQLHARRQPHADHLRQGRQRQRRARARRSTSAPRSTATPPPRRAPPSSTTMCSATST